MNGKVVLPDDARFNDARRAFNLAVDQRPSAIVYPESAHDAAAVVRWARASGQQVTAQTTGHNASPLGPLQNTILLKTERMRQISIDPVARTARVEAGVIWIEVLEAAAPHGLAPLSGSSPNVGVAGDVLGGGISFLGRKYGLSANHVRAIELVTADGMAPGQDYRTSIVRSPGLAGPGELRRWSPRQHPCPVVAARCIRRAVGWSAALESLSWLVHLVRIRLCPHSGFSVARRTTRRAMLETVGGRPGLRCPLVSYFAATSLRSQVRSVAGVTGKISVQCLRGRSRVSAANQARSAGSYRIRPTWRRSTAFSCRSTSSSASFARSLRNSRKAAPSIRHVSR